MEEGKCLQVTIGYYKSFEFKFGYVIKIELFLIRYTFNNTFQKSIFIKRLVEGKAKANNH